MILKIWLYIINSVFYIFKSKSIRLIKLKFSQKNVFFLQVHIEKQINFILAKHAFQYPESIIFSGLISLCKWMR